MVKFISGAVSGIVVGFTLGVLLVNYSYRHADTTPPQSVEEELPLPPPSSEKTPSTSAPILPNDVISEPEEEAVACLSDNIYHESRGLPLSGQMSVGLVTLNRVKSSKFKNTVCDVVWRKRTMKSGKEVAQFSWTLSPVKDKAKNLEVYAKTTQLASYLLSNKDNVQDITNGSLFFHDDSVKPYWASSFKLQHKIGKMLFYSYK